MASDEDQEITTLRGLLGKQSLNLTPKIKGDLLGTAQDDADRAPPPAPSPPKEHRRARTAEPGARHSQISGFYELIQADRSLPTEIKAELTVTRLEEKSPEFWKGAHFMWGVLARNHFTSRHVRTEEAIKNMGEDLGRISKDLADHSQVMQACVNSIKIEGDRLAGLVMSASQAFTVQQSKPLKKPALPQNHPPGTSAVDVKGRKADGLWIAQSFRAGNASSNSRAVCLFLNTLRQEEIPAFVDISWDWLAGILRETTKFSSDAKKVVVYDAWQKELSRRGLAAAPQTLPETALVDPEETIPKTYARSESLIYPQTPETKTKESASSRTRTPDPQVVYKSTLSLEEVEAAIEQALASVKRTGSALSRSASKRRLEELIKMKEQMAQSPPRKEGKRKVRRSRSATPRKNQAPSSGHSTPEPPDTPNLSDNESGNPSTQ
uniref:Uncharacterized protein n=1 Tax=Yanbian Rhabd tick virus 2 TaxID=2972330 RepID=A0A9E7V2A7_9RHAB|nr:MAG: hypothetical protein [Yanbian Rhabd tick virus 2]